MLAHTYAVMLQELNDIQLAKLGSVPPEEPAKKKRSILLPALGAAALVGGGLLLRKRLGRVASAAAPAASSAAAPAAASVGRVAPAAAPAVDARAMELLQKRLRDHEEAQNKYWTRRRLSADARAADAYTKETGAPLGEPWDDLLEETPEHNWSALRAAAIRMAEDQGHVVPPKRSPLEPLKDAIRARARAQADEAAWKWLEAHRTAIVAPTI